MNILFTSPTYHPHKGGAESLIEDLACDYVKKGHRVTVLTSRSPRSLPASENRDGVDIHRLVYPPQTVKTLKQAFLVIIHSLSVSVKLLRFIKRRKIDIVCIGLVGIDSFFVLVLNYLLRFKLVVYIHGGEIRSYIKVSRLIRWTFKKCLHHCHAAIVVSDKLKDETVAVVPSVKDKIYVIPNGVDLKKIREQEGYDHPRDYLLYAGRLHPVKGVDTLINAFHRVSDQVPGLDLLIAGTGPVEGELKRLVEARGLTQRIGFLGAQEKSDVFALLKGCEFLVLPSHAEGCPVILLEAMAANKTAIGSRAKGITDLIEHEKNGLLFNPGDVEALSELIFRCYTHQSVRSRLEENITKMNLEMYDIRNLSEKHLEVYAGLKRKLKICLISAFYYQDENCAGLSSYYFNLSKSLSDLGHSMYLITSEQSPQTNEVKNLQTVEIKQRGLLEEDHAGAGVKGLTRTWARLLFSFKAYLKAKELDRSLGLDVIIAPELFAQGLFVGLLMGQKLFTRIHTPTYLADHYNERYQYRLIGRMLSVPEKVQAKMSRGLSVASEHLASVISKDWGVPKEKIRVIPNSIQTDWVRRLAAEQAKEVAGEYLLYFGRLERRKGVHIISLALQEVFLRKPEVTMVFIGKDCGLKKEILRENQNNQNKILFFETLEKGKLFGMIRDAKLVLLPSLFENLSNAGLEAMALGRPVIGTYETAFEEIIQDGVNGFLVEPGDAQALSAKILSCLEMSDLESIGQNAYQSILRFDSRRIASQYIEFYRQAISKP